MKILTALIMLGLSISGGAEVPKDINAIRNMVENPDASTILPYNIVGVDDNWNAIASCTIRETTSVSYTDSSCKVSMASTIATEVQLGACANNPKIKIIIDDKMYKYNTNITVMKDLLAMSGQSTSTVDVILIDDTDGTTVSCSGTGSETELQLVIGNSIVNLDTDTGITWGVDGNGKPVLRVVSQSGNASCTGGVVVNVEGEDIIFKDGFE